MIACLLDWRFFPARTTPLTRQRPITLDHLSCRLYGPADNFLFCV